MHAINRPPAVRPPSAFNFPVPAFRSQDGVALVIILAFIVLLTGVVVAFFSRAISERQVSNSSASQTKAEIFAQGATDQIIGDLKQEIADGSTITSPATGVNLYIPKDTTGGAISTIIPADQGFTRTYDATSKIENDGLNNLVKRSAYNVKFYDKGKNTNYAVDGVSRAANAASTTPSQNGRLVSLPRWNKPLLLSKAKLTSDTDLSPVATYTAPDWVLTARDGTNPTVFGSGATAVNNTSSTNYVVGRYAYTIYDEGGLLDMNVAGYPTNLGATDPDKNDPAYKSALSFADLTQLKDSSGNALLTQTQIDQIVGWRNYASSQSTTLGTFPNYSWDAAATKSYYQSILTNSKGFLSAPAMAAPSTQTDRFFSGRQQLVNLLTQGIATDANQRATLQNALQYLTTFDRSLNQPSYVPPTVTYPNAPIVLQDGTTLFGGNNAFGGDGTINPSFLSSRVVTAFQRNDGRSATAGEPLVVKRFSLNRLSWITCKGPSASNLSDPIVTAMKAQGVPLSLLQQGTPSNIYKFFGLSWDPTNHKWIYDHNSITPPTGVPVPTKAGTTNANIFTLSGITGREPDYFELLKAALKAGSLGKHGSLGRDQGQQGELVTQGTKVQYRRDIMIDMQCFAIGLNIIDQADPDNYPTRLLVWNPISTAPSTRELCGVENLPYIYRMRNGVVRLAEASTTNKPANANDNAIVAKTGAAALLLYPELWNPHSADSPATGINPQTGTPFSGIAPTTFQIVANSVDPDHYGSEMPMELSQNSNGDSRFKYTEVPAPIISPRTALTDNPTSAAQRNPAVQFDIPDGNTALFREPTILLKSNTPANTNYRVVSWPSEVTTFVSGGGLTSSKAVGGDIPADAPANGGEKYSAGAGLSGSSLTGTGPFVGLLMGRAPLQVWRSDNQYQTVGSLQGNFQSGAGASLTVRLQYQDPWGTYVSYNEVDPPVFDGVSVKYICIPELVQNLVVTFDPRTARFGMMQNDNGYDYAFISATGISETDRSRANDAGRGFKQNDFARGGPSAPGGINWSNPNPMSLGGSGVGAPSPGWFGDSGGWSGNVGVPTLIVQNDPSLTQFGNMFYADPDGVVRRGMGAYSRTAAGGATDPGNPMKTGDNQSRPILLNRPFRAVSELGHVFRDTPWKNLDFFTPESADNALLDVFCINDTGNVDQLVAGKVNLNTRQQPVIKAILAGAFKDDLKSLGTAGSLSPLSTTEADKIATLLVSSSQTTPPQMNRLQNVADLIGSWSGNRTLISNTDQTGKGYGVDGKLSYTGFTKQLTAAAFDATSQNPSWYIQRMHESTTRALAAVGQTRVWNLMIDVIAQTGRYPTTAVALDKFAVEGEQRYWVHLAIDRYTGQVLDKQVEVVKE